MKREDFIKEVSLKLKLIRTENLLTQEKMAEFLHISKKTLVEIEKGRGLLTFACAALTVLLFEDSLIVDSILGRDALESIKSMTFDEFEHHPPKTMGGKIWWGVLQEEGSYVLQQNIISSHYRILDCLNCRIFSTFNEKLAQEKFKLLIKKSKKE